jgi:hypothetical protein
MRSDSKAEFICGQLSNSCKADKAALDTCDRATSAAENTTPAGSGAQADAFNAAFGIHTVSTHFLCVPAVFFFGPADKS